MERCLVRQSNGSSLGVWDLLKFCIRRVHLLPSLSPLF
uniref:Uncharacterized protein n=1 Tax=Anguilla anguilla TaxID=7936 RepID=A0A0E9VXS3_ANGAN